MRQRQSLLWFKLTATACLLVLATWLLRPNFSSPVPGRLLDVPKASTDLPAAKPTVVRSLPSDDPTGEPTAIPPTPIPTWTPGPFTPTPAVLQPATLITPIQVSIVAPAGPAALTEKSTIDSTEGIQDITWAPTGDKLVYLTVSGKLYWSNTNGSNATLLHDYQSTFSGPLDQMPMTNTLLVPGYIIKFTVGQSPVFTTASATYLRQLRWWSPDRASGVAGGPLVGDYVGSERLVTVNADGSLVDKRNIPYMWSGAVRPGGRWLAYTTGQQATGTPFYDSYPQTTYLLDLDTGQHLQITEAGKGYDVLGWSPNGAWFLMAAVVEQALRGVLVSADGQEWIIVTPAGMGGYDATWRPDSRQLAFSVVKGGCNPEDTPPCPMNSEVYIIDVPSRKVSDVAEVNSSPNSASQMMRPSWSPNGEILALLSVDPNGTGRYSSLEPSVYLMQR